MSYLTPDEKLRVQIEMSDCNETIGYQNVSQTQLSIARWAGGCTIGTRLFTYFPEHDELWRDDVVKMVKRWRKEEKNASKPTYVQGDLQL